MKKEKNILYPYMVETVLIFKFNYLFKTEFACTSIINYMLYHKVKS